jgi:hypothetical protein
MSRVSKVFGKKSAARPHLVVGAGGISGEVQDLRKDTEEAFLASEKSNLVCRTFIRAASAVAVSAGIRGTFASVAAPTTLTGADFDGILAPGTGPALIDSPRQIVFTVGGGGTPANWLGGNITYTGTDADGKVQTETVVSAAGAGSVTTTKFFKTLVTAALPAASGTLAQLTLGVAADTAPIASITAATIAQVLDTNAEFNRDRIGNREMDIPRRISFVFSNSAEWLASNITLTGECLGVTVTETIAIPGGGNTTVTSSKFYTQITKISVPVQGGATATCAVTLLNTELGLSTDILSSVVAVSVIREGNDPGTGTWAVPTAGTVADASSANSGPNGKYTPNVAPDGGRSYALVYIPNPA